jgi:molecular chaperone GrpE (heat shock protein)
MENKKEERCKFPAVAKAVIFDRNTDKFLVIKSTSKDKEFLEKYGPWEIPGGKLEKKESIKEGLLREIKEEVGGIELEIRRPIRARKIEFSWGDMIFIDFLAELKSGEIELSEEHEEFRWETAEEIAKNDEYKEWLRDLIVKAEKILKSEEYLNGWKRCQADFENYKKRQAENLKDAFRYANEGIIAEILPVLDNFYASTGHIPEGQKNDAWVTGIMHIQKQLEKVLEDNNVSEIKIKPGDKFDPSTMEAIENKECKQEDCKNIVKQVAARGYKIGGRVIRAARVIVE